MYRWYVAIEINGKAETIRSNADTLDEAKKEIEKLHPGSQYMGHIETRKI